MKNSAPAPVSTNTSSQPPLFLCDGRKDATNSYQPNQLKPFPFAAHYASVESSSIFLSCDCKRSAWQLTRCPNTAVSNSSLRPPSKKKQYNTTNSLWTRFCKEVPFNGKIILLKANPRFPPKTTSTSVPPHLLSLRPELGSFLLTGAFLRKPRVPQTSTGFVERNDWKLLQIIHLQVSCWKETAKIS